MHGLHWGCSFAVYIPGFENGSRIFSGFVK